MFPLPPSVLRAVKVAFSSSFQAPVLPSNVGKGIYAPLLRKTAHLMDLTVRGKQDSLSRKNTKADAVPVLGSAEVVPLPFIKWAQRATANAQKRILWPEFRVHKAAQDFRSCKPEG